MIEFYYEQVYALHLILYTNALSLSIGFYEILFAFSDFFKECEEMTFAERLKQRRNELGLTQAELAKKAELTLRTIQNYEGGTRKPLNIEMVQRLAVALNTTTEYLTGTSSAVVEAYEKGGARSARDVDQIVSEVAALFAGGELSDEQKEGVMAALNRAYWDAKETNKKYTPKKYRK